MKNLFNFRWIAMLAVVATVSAQQEKGITGSNNWLNNWTEFKPTKVEYNETNQILYGKITTNTTLSKKNTYLLQGPVYVTNGAVLTIEAGTTIKGDSETGGVLVITKGAKIMAEGTETDPIVFTSNKPVRKAGDWGGLIILGDAPINKFGGSSSMNHDLDPAMSIYGGVNAASNSGVLRFLRIEFAGKKIKGFKDYNALSIAGVGNKTVFENVMCSYTEGNAVEVLGGDTNLRNMVTLRSTGDDFRFTQGAQCRIDNSLAVRHSLYSGSARARCMNVNSYDKKEEADFKLLSNVVATNCTLLNNTENLAADITSGLVKEAVFVGDNVSFALRKSVISGFMPAVILDEQIKLEGGGLKKIELKEVFFNYCKGNVYVQNTSNNEDLEDYYGNSQFANLYENSPNNEAFIDVSPASKNPDFRVKIGKFTASK